MVLYLVTTKVFWAGSCKLENVYFCKEIVGEYHERHLHEYINQIWIDFKIAYPESYNGTLVYLQSFEHDEELESPESHLFFTISYMKYATYIGMMKLNVPIKHFGALGTQVAIFDESAKYILVGRRKYDQFYAPGLLTVPGGILEKKDVYHPKDLLLRELNEEVKMRVKEPKVVALLSEHTNYSTILFITAILDQSFNKDEIFKESENEFDKHELFWLETSILKQFNEDELMEGLTYLKNTLSL